MANINEKLKVLGMYERIKILEYINGISSDISEKLALITAEVLLYLIQKNALPTELNPNTWNLPE